MSFLITFPRKNSFFTLISPWKGHFLSVHAFSGAFEPNNSLVAIFELFFIFFFEFGYLFFIYSLSLSSFDPFFRTTEDIFSDYFLIRSLQDESDIFLEQGFTFAIVINNQSHLGFIHYFTANFQIVLIFGISDFNSLSDQFVWIYFDHCHHQNPLFWRLFLKLGVL